MIGLLIPFLTYAEWFFLSHERQAVYPFDSRYESPEVAGVPGLAETRLTAGDGTELILWQRPADTGRPTILYLPGNSGNLLGRAARFRDLAGRGYGLVALSWRGQGGSGGRPDEAALTADALMVYDRFANLDPVLYGESLGTAAAIRIAARREVRAVVLESPFTSLADLAEAQYPGESLRPLLTQTWESGAEIGALREPLLILQGSSDRLVPVAQGERLLAAAGSTDKALVRIDGRDHLSLWGPPAQAALDAFLARLPGR